MPLILLDADPTGISTPPSGKLAVTAYQGKFYVVDSAGLVQALNNNVITSVSSTAGAVNFDCNTGDYFTLTLTENVTSITFSNLPGAGRGGTKWIQITQGAGPFTVAWPASFKWPGGIADAVSTGSGDIDVLAISTVDNGVTWLATLGKNFS